MDYPATALHLSWFNCGEKRGRARALEAIWAERQMADVLKNLTLGLDALFTRRVSNSAHGPLTMFLNNLSRAGILPSCRVTV
jgi:hypothetical protein